jgi:hypothetical protein
MPDAKGTPYQNANGGIMVGVVDVVRDLLYDLKQHLDKIIMNAGCSKMVHHISRWSLLCADHVPKSLVLIL